MRGGEVDSPACSIAMMHRFVVSSGQRGNVWELVANHDRTS